MVLYHVMRQESIQSVSVAGFILAGTSGGSTTNTEDVALHEEGPTGTSMSHRWASWGRQSTRPSSSTLSSVPRIGYSSGRTLQVRSWRGKSPHHGASEASHPVPGPSSGRASRCKNEIKTETPPDWGEPTAEDPPRIGGGGREDDLSGAEALATRSPKALPGAGALWENRLQKFIGVIRSSVCWARASWFPRHDALGRDHVQTCCTRYVDIAVRFISVWSARLIDDRLDNYIVMAQIRKGRPTIHHKCWSGRQKGGQIWKIVRRLPRPRDPWS